MAHRHRPGGSLGVMLAAEVIVKLVDRVDPVAPAIPLSEEALHLFLGARLAAIEFTGDLLATPHDAASLALPRTGGAPWLAFAGRSRGKAVHVEVPAADRPACEGRLERLECEARRPRLGSPDAIRALLHLIVVDIARLLAPSGGERPAGSALVHEVLVAIDRRYAEPGLSLSGIARAVGRSSSHVTATLRAQTGMTVLEWLTERRMAEARRRLHEGQPSSSTAALMSAAPTGRGHATASTILTMSRAQRRAEAWPPTPAVGAPRASAPRRLEHRP